MNINLNKQQMYHIQDFQGINNRQDLHKIPDNKCYLCKNISFVKVGTLKKRFGSELKGITQAGNGVQGLIEYIDNTGTKTLRAIRSTDLDILDTGGNWTDAETSVFTAGEKVSSVRFLNRVYHISQSTPLRYETGMTTTVVGSGLNTITGQSITEAQGTLFVAKDDTVYYSKFDIINNTPTDQLWEDGESLATSTRFFKLPSRHTAMFSYGVTGLNYIFTDRACYSFDVSQAENGTGVKKVFDIGCAGIRAIGQCQNLLIWIDGVGKPWGWDTQGLPFPIAWDIDDDSNGESIIANIDKTQLADIAFGALGSIFRFSVGDITVWNRTIENAQIVGFLSQNLQTINWSLYSYPYRAIIFANAFIDDKEALLYGASNIDDVYELDTGLNDGDVPIDAFYLSKFYKFDAPDLDTVINKLLIEYKPTQQKESYLEVNYALNSIIEYTPITNPDDIDPVTDFGQIDMYNSDPLKFDEVKLLGVPSELKYKTLSLELANGQLDEQMEVSAIYIYGESRPFDLRISI